MGKCEVCGLETENLYECSICGCLVCGFCDNGFICDDCWQREHEDEFWK